MPKKYHRPVRSVSRLEKQQAQKLVRQTYLIIATTVGLILILIFVGIPALIKLAIFLGDVRGSSLPIEPTDTIAPAAPQLTTPPNATTGAKLTLTGYAETGATVKLYHNNQELTDTLTNNDGTFTFSSLELDSGSNRFSAKAIDPAGNESPLSPVVTVTYDANAPDLTISSPNSGERFFGRSEQTVTVTGTTDPGTGVRINDRLAVVDSLGVFSLPLQLNEGDNTITITATDPAGNTTTKEVKVSYSP